MKKMQVSRLKELFEIEGVAEMQGNALYVIQMRVNATMEQMTYLKTLLNSKGLDCIVLSREVSIHKVERADTKNEGRKGSGDQMSAAEDLLAEE